MKKIFENGLYKVLSMLFSALGKPIVSVPDSARILDLNQIIPTTAFIKTTFPH